MSELEFPIPETPGLMRQEHDDAALTLRTFHVGERGVSIRHQLSRGNIDHSAWISQGGFRGSLSFERNCIEYSSIGNRGCARTLCCTISLRMTDLDVIEVATIGVFPANCDTLCVRCMSTWFREIVGFHTVPSEQVTRRPLNSYR